MARGDITMFEEAKAYMIDGGWGASDVIKLALITNATVPTASDTTPILSEYTECSGGNYTAGGETLDTLANMITEVGGTVTFDDTGASVTWLQNGSNPQNAYYALIYNSTTGSQCIAFIDLAGPIDMQAGDLTITWHGSGIFTLT